jgi:hypothetical protein
MRKAVITSFAVGVGMLAFAAMGQTQNLPSSPGKADAPMDSKSASAKQANGEVTSVDAKAGKLMVKTTTEELNLEVQGSTAKNSLADIKVGDKVNVSFQDKGGMLVATSVRKASEASDAGKASTGKDNMGTSTKSH